MSAGPIALSSPGRRSRYSRPAAFTLEANAVSYATAATGQAASARGTTGKSMVVPATLFR